MDHQGTTTILRSLAVALAAVLASFATPTLPAPSTKTTSSTFWGEVRGAFPYETAIGGSNTVPSVLVRYLSLVEKR